MNRSLSRALGVFAALAFSASISVSSAVAATPEPDPSEGPRQEYFLPRTGVPENPLKPDGAPGARAGTDASVAALCQFTNAVDSLHLSKTQTTWGTISVHGWWRNGNCPATKAVVTTQLQKKNNLGLWFDIGSKGVKTVYSSDGGSANRSNSRYDCVAYENNQYRAWVDVDVVGVDDLPGRIYTPAFTFNCD